VESSDAAPDRLVKERAREQDGEHGFEIQQQCARRGTRTLKAPGQQARRDCATCDRDQDQSRRVGATYAGVATADDELQHQCSECSPGVEQRGR
jgi:hypothetical protein